MKPPITNHFLDLGILCLLTFVFSQQATLAQALPMPSSEQSHISVEPDHAFNLLLNKGGWSMDACRAWWLVNERRLKATAEVAPDLVEKELRLFYQMQPKGRELRLIEKHPEAAGILLLAHKRDALASAILAAPESDQDMLVASYLFCTTGTEVDEWTEAVARHPGPIALFQRRCAVLPYHGLFAYLAKSPPMSPDTREIYGKWLDEVLALPVMTQSDERMLSRLNFAATCGPEVRTRLKGDPTFRQNFLKVIWPRFRDSMIYLTQTQGEDSQDVFIYCGGEPLVWDFFKRENSEILFRQVGMDAVLLLEGPDALHPDVQGAAMAMWAKGILDLPQMLQEYQSNTHFLSLLRRFQEEAKWSMLNAVCFRLEEKGPQWPSDVAYLDGLSESAMKKELNPTEPSIIPGAALFSLASKFVDGRRVGISDFLVAGIDAADIALAIATLGSSKGLTTAAKAGAQKMIQQSLRTTAIESAEKLAGRTLKTVAETGTIEWTQDIVQEGMKRLPDAFRTKMKIIGIVDISEPVKAGFKLSRKLGVGRNPFKKLTGLEARVFMRQDGRVFINFANVITKPNPAMSFLTRTFENGILQSPPVEDGVESSAAVVHQWKEDVSAWWIGNATGQF